MGKLTDEHRKTDERLFNVAYFIAKKGSPFADLPDLLELEKYDGVQFFENEKCENEFACIDFIEFTFKSIFKKNDKLKLQRLKFVAFMRDDSADSALLGKECIYISLLIRIRLDRL